MKKQQLQLQLQTSVLYKKASTFRWRGLVCTLGSQECCTSRWVRNAFALHSGSNNESNIFLTALRAEPSPSHTRGGSRCAGSQCSVLGPGRRGEGGGFVPAAAALQYRPPTHARRTSPAMAHRPGSAALPSQTCDKQITNC